MRSMMMKGDKGQSDFSTPRPEAAGNAPVDSPNLSRRQWLTGVLAGPAVVSLPTTASAAAFGSISRCVENSHSGSRIPLFVGMAEQDEWARTLKKAHLVSKGGGNGYRETLLVGFDSGTLMDASYNQWIWEGMDKCISPWGDTYRYDGVLVDVLCLVWMVVDNVSSFISDNPDATQWGGVPVTGSCYVSIADLV